MQVRATAEMEWVPLTKNNVRTGKVARKFLGEGEFLPGKGYVADLVQHLKGEPFTAPRHRHNYEQIRFGIQGKQDYGAGIVCVDGGVGYFPEGAYYGPESIEDALVLVVQWGDEFVSRQQNNDAIEALKTRGEFRDGIYTSIDENGKRYNRDAVQAIWEEVFKRSLEFPVPRYPQPIVMNPKGFAWTRLNDHVSWKCLGRFTERDLVIALVRWDRDGGYELPAERTQMLFSTKGAINVDGSAYGAHTVVWSDFTESVTVSGEQGSEAICLGFPREVHSIAVI